MFAYAMCALKLILVKVCLLFRWYCTVSFDHSQTELFFTDSRSGMWSMPVKEAIFSDY